MMAPKSQKMVTREPCDTETIKHGSEGGGWKSACKGNSLAAYPTSRPVRREGWVKPTFRKEGKAPRPYSIFPCFGENTVCQGYFSKNLMES